jgi:hypothetical protein
MDFVTKLLLVAYPTCTLTLPAADSFHYLLTVVTYRAEEHPSFKTIEAVPSLLTVLLLFIRTDGVPGKG